MQMLMNAVAYYRVYPIQTKANLQGVQLFTNLYECTEVGIYRKKENKLLAKKEGKIQEKRKKHAFD